jgi:Protein of unknown function (DUF5656)
VLRPRYLPNPDRLSIIGATILLAYSLAHLIELPGQEFAVQLPGIYLNFTLNVNSFITLLVAGLTAVGADWLFRSHPVVANESAFEHLIIPALTAWVIGRPMLDLPLNPLWWLGFILGGSLLMVVLVAEYVTMDPEDVRQPVAASGLIAVSFALFLALMVALKYEDLRLVQILPAIALGAWLVSLRTFHLRLNRWAAGEAGIVALLVVELATALHYWPLSPTAYALALLAPTYALTRFIIDWLDGEPIRQAIVEPVLVLAVVWSIAFWLR